MVYPSLYRSFVSEEVDLLVGSEVGCVDRSVIVDQGLGLFLRIIKVMKTFPS